MKIAPTSLLVLLVTLPSLVMAGGGGGGGHKGYGNNSPSPYTGGGCSGGGCSKKKGGKEKVSGKGNGNGNGGYYYGGGGTGCTGKKCYGVGKKSDGVLKENPWPLCFSSPSLTPGVDCIDSPLVFDMNHDRGIEVVKGRGVRMNRNNPGEHNGAAAKGDKMLAMCDMDKSGDIDGAEVFGDATRNPFFAGNPWIKAANGFDALYEVAKAAAERFPELNIIKLEEEDTMVNLPNLKQALQRVECDLGFIGDDNVSHLESLRDVTWVKVSGYQSTPDDIQDGVLFGQKSWFSDASGRRWAVDDVWFPSHLRR